MIDDLLEKKHTGYGDLEKGQESLAGIESCSKTCGVWLLWAIEPTAEQNIKEGKQLADE